MKRFSKTFPLLFVLSLFLLLFTIVVGIPVSAEPIVFACNSTGFPHQSYYTNETVYVSGNMTGPYQNVDMYIVNHQTSWSNGTILVNLSLGYRIIQANESGGINASVLWQMPNVGSYDVIADVDRDGVYNTITDVVDNVSVAGFTVIEAPKPTLTVELGKHNPASHDCDLDTQRDHNVMMQINVSASTMEDIRIDSMAITAFGSGDDKDDIHVVYLIYDVNGDAVYDSGDALIAYSSYLRDDGAIFFDVGEGFLIDAGKSKPLTITYTMSTSGSIDDTYRFDLISLTGYGRYTGQTVAVNGLPLGSAIKTISNEASVTTTTSPGETTTTIPGDACQVDSDCGGSSCLARTRVTNRCTYDSATGFNKCIESSVDVECCYDGDCAEGFYCINYECVKEKTGGFFDWLDFGGGEGEGKFPWTLVSIVAVVVGVIVVFFLIKNRKRDLRGSSGAKGGEDEWSILKKKWRENK